MKYCEQKNIAPFDWREALSRPAEEIEWPEANELADKARDWQECYCGQIDNRIPRYGDGEPRDKQLSNLGVSFYENLNHMAVHIWNDSPEAADSRRLEALAIIHQIEKRASEIIAGLNDSPE